MKPYVLKSHARPLTQVRFNTEGDLLFTCSKDAESAVALFYTSDGERVGTFQGHTGAVMTCDVSLDSSLLLTGSADSSVRLWDVQTGAQKCLWDTQTPARAVAFAKGEKLAAVTTDPFMMSMPTVRFFAISDTPEESPAEPVLQIDMPTRLHRPQRIYFTDCSRTLVVGCEDGFVRRYDVETGKCILEAQVHDGELTDLAMSADGTHMASSSKDKTGKLLDVQTLEVLHTYQHERPINAIALNPVQEHVAMAGGQDASSVTTTADAAGGFETRFFHKIYEDEFGRVRGHFGPVNSVTFSPDGKSFVTGGEDGFVRLSHFDMDYFTTTFFLEP